MPEQELRLEKERSASGLSHVGGEVSVLREELLAMRGQVDRREASLRAEMEVQCFLKPILVSPGARGGKEVGCYDRVTSE